MSLINKRTLLLILTLFIWSSCNAQKENEKTKSLGEIDTAVEKALKEKKIPSLAVGVVKDGEVVYSKAFGMADVENVIETNTETFYQLGSVTKTMVGHVLATLVQNKKMSLSDPIDTYFPESLDFPTGPGGEAVTVQHIATHTAGFPRYPENLERVDPNPILGYSKEQLYKGIELVKIEKPLGKEFSYSNFGYGILAAAMENATGESLSELLERYLFRPAGMNQSSLTINQNIKSRLSKPYLEVAPYKPTEPWQMGALAGAGNVFSNLKEMNQFLLYLLKNDDVRRLQQTPLVTLEANESWRYGLGCFVISSEKLNTTRIHHGGDVDGYASTINIYPDHNLGMVILINNGDYNLFAEVFKETRNLVADYYLNSSEAE